MLPISLFVQVPSLLKRHNEAQVRSWFEKIGSEYRRKGSPNYIFDLCLSEVAVVDAESRVRLAEDELNVIKDYLNRFDNLFVGTVVIEHPDPYADGIMDESFRWQNIIASRNATTQFIDYIRRQQLYIPSINWYSSYEGVLNHFLGATGRSGRDHSGDDIKEAYKAYLGQLVRDLRDISRANGFENTPAILWSPAFWTHYAHLSERDRAALCNSLCDLFQAVPQLTWLHFQDFVGQTAIRRADGSIVYDFTAEDAVGYFHNVLVPANRTATLKSIAVNMELFLMDGIFPGDAFEHIDRLCAYRRAHVPIGFCWEIRHWYKALYG